MWRNILLDPELPKDGKKSKRLFFSNFKEKNTEAVTIDPSTIGDYEASNISVGVQIKGNNTSKIDVYCPPINEQNSSFFSAFSSSNTRQLEIKSEEFTNFGNTSKKNNKEIPWVE